ncbi:cilia- and flagella-associated protein 20-like [Prorops nasuta]|uniref:cilia- and flagella-associated protein 20-like n=1 Tax=Prorops nasuta TaxID=863751 RepID=UPI0034CE71F8
MFRNAFQQKFLSILYSVGSSPLKTWGIQVRNGYVRRVTDEEVKALVLELSGLNVATTYIYCPPDPREILGITLPFLIMIIKNMKKYFTFEITIRDNQNMRRRFRFSNFQSTTRVKTFCTSCPIALTTSDNSSWNQIQFNLPDLTHRAYGTSYVETIKMQIHANCRVRRIYFADRLYAPENTPDEYKLLMPLDSKVGIRETRKSTLKEKVPSVTKLPDFEMTEDQIGLVKTSAVPSEAETDYREMEEERLSEVYEDKEDEQLESELSDHGEAIEISGQEEEEYEEEKEEEKLEEEAKVEEEVAGEEEDTKEGEEEKRQEEKRQESEETAKVEETEDLFDREDEEEMLDTEEAE